MNHLGPTLARTGNAAVAVDSLQRFGHSLCVSFVVIHYQDAYRNRG
jgi:hypothetical protein